MVKDTESTTSTITNHNIHPMVKGRYTIRDVEYFPLLSQRTGVSGSTTFQNKTIHTKEKMSIPVRDRVAKRKRFPAE